MYFKIFIFLFVFIPSSLAMDIDAQLSLIRQEYLAGDAVRSLSRAKKLLKQFPNSIPTKLELAKIYRLSGFSEKSASIYLDLLLLGKAKLGDFYPKLVDEFSQIYSSPSSETRFHQITSREQKRENGKEFILRFVVESQDFKLARKKFLVKVYFFQKQKDGSLVKIQNFVQAFWLKDFPWQEENQRIYEASCFLNNEENIPVFWFTDLYQDGKLVDQRFSSFKNGSILPNMLPLIESDLF